MAAFCGMPLVLAQLGAGRSGPRWHTAHMSNVLLLLPDFLLIVLGYVLCHRTALNRPVWEATERLVYFLLFPVLLFNAVLRSPLHLGETLSFAGAGVGAVGVGIVVALAIGQLPGVDAKLHASGAQTAFRFNSYIGLALADRLLGAPGVAAMALLLALCVPLCNVAAVWPLAKHGGHSYLRELARNPLIIATLAGLLGNVLGLTLPEAVNTVMTRVGTAALPLGLMAVGAGLQIGGLRSGPRLAASFMLIRHALVPLAGLALSVLLALTPEQRLIVVAFAALPTASSAYVLAARMGGNGPYVAGLVTLSTLLGMVSVPVWLAVLGTFAP
jgi:malonate transporter